MRPTSYIELQSRIDNDYPAGRGYYLKSGFVREMTPGLIDAVVGILEAGPAPRCIASFLQLGGAITRVAPEVHGLLASRGPAPGVARGLLGRAGGCRCAA